MADVRPFRFIRYEERVAGGLSGNLCPPFDVISADRQRELYERSDYNVVRLEFGVEYHSDKIDDNRYTRARDDMQEWLSAGALVREQEPAVFVTRESFTFRGRDHSRRGLLCAVRLEEFERGVVMPHEFTRPEPKRDRLELMKETRANFSPLMVLYRDEGGVGAVLDRVCGLTPEWTADPPGMPALELWRVSDAAMINEIVSPLRRARLFMADGHHRYETAIAYRDLAGEDGDIGEDAAARFRMMTLIAIDDPGLLLLGYHRVVRGARSDELDRIRMRLTESFELEDRRLGNQDEHLAARLEAELAGCPRDRLVFAVAGLTEGAVHIASARSPASAGAELAASDYTQLEEQLLRPALAESRVSEAVGFEHDASQAIRAVDAGEAQIALIMRAVRLDRFERIVSTGRRLPPKSTFFHPKLHTGAVIQDLEGEL